MKEPIQMIEEMYSIILKMQGQLAVMDNNIKLLQAKVNAEVFAGLSGMLTTNQLTHTSPPNIPLPQAPPPQVQPKIALPQEESITYKGTMVQGKILSDEGKPLHGISIKIMNSDKKVIKETSTNRAGLWMAQLKPGKYIAKAIMDNKPAQFKLFDVIEGQAAQDV
jgi:hypothetical protein